jgi:hypothetical protein
MLSAPLRDRVSIGSGISYAPVPALRLSLGCCSKALCPTSFLPVPKFRRRSFTRSQRQLPPPLGGQCSRPCQLQFHASPRREFVRPLATSLRAGFEALRGDIHARDPFSVPLLSAALPVSSLHSPFGLATIRIKAFYWSSHREPASGSVTEPFGIVPPGVVMLPGWLPGG